MISLNTSINKLPKKNIITIIAWSFFDWANSAFATIITTFIISAYFTRYIATNEIIGTSQWGDAIAIAGILIAIFSPIFGAIADHGTSRKPWLGLFTAVAIVSMALLWNAYPHPSYVYFTLACVVCGTLGIEIGMVFYNALLPNIAPKGFVGRVSGWAWGLGYAGGLSALIIALFCFVQSPPSWLSTATAAQVRITGPFAAVWLLVFSLPLFLLVPDRNPNGVSLVKAMKIGLKELGGTLKTLPNHKAILIFLIAHMIYIDGLNTVFAFGGIYAAGTFNMKLAQIIQLGIAMNVAAGIGAAVFAWIDDYLGAKPTILFSLGALLLTGIGLVLTHSVVWFWILGIILAIFVGPVQAASRSLMVRLVPKAKATQFFGLYAFSGKVTTFIGPWIFGLATLHFASQRAGISTVLIFFLIGAILLLAVREPQL